MSGLVILAFYLFALFLLGLGNAVVVYHILRYRDPDDASGFVLLFYGILVVIVLASTALLISWQELIPNL